MSLKFVRDASQFVARLEDGDFGPKLMAKVNETVAALTEKAGPDGKAKGSVTIEIDFEIIGNRLHSTPTLKNKVPKKTHRSSVLWVNDEGDLCTEHPKQKDMFDGPTELRRAE